MAKTYRLSPLAVEDLEAIWLYTLKHWSRAQADSYHRDFIRAFKGLAAGTKKGLPTVLAGFQKCLCGSHVIYFLDNGEYLDVIRVLHQRQDAVRHLP